ncbi:hypothetical protein M3Y98_00273300 [Aphelenchoides besseyi]|nr:hypothetical protein M3Y98_00273300 [Aphelenchoides besseyi]
MSGTEDEHNAVLIHTDNDAAELVNTIDANSSDTESQNRPHTPTDLSRFQVFAYSFGHFYNDLCSSIWFTYLMIYLEKVILLRSSRAGLLMLIGQATDALCTPLVGLLSDAGVLPEFLLKIGKRKAWHLMGTIAVSLSFPFIFSGCLTCKSGQSEWWHILWFAIFIIIFQTGWASVQISHLAMIPELSSSSSTRISMNSYRYAFGVLANLTIFSTMFLMLHGDKNPIGPSDLRFFKQITIGVVCIGLLVVLMFYFFIKEPDMQLNRRASMSLQTTQTVKMRWRCWFGQRSFYSVAFLYMFCRLFINASQVYFPFYITLARDMDKSNVATLPMLSYIASFIVSCVMGLSSVNRMLNRKIVFLFGGCLGVCISVLFYFTTDHISIYFIALLMGTAQSTLLISSLGATAQLINKNTVSYCSLSRIIVIQESGAFVYGSMSFLDKLSNGFAYQLIELINPTCDAKYPHEACRRFYRDIMSYVPGSMGVLSKIADRLNIPTVVCDCREVIHVWNPGCFAALMEAFPLSFLFAMKTYGTLYCITGLIKLRKNKRFKWKSILFASMRSSTFITVNMMMYLYVTCKLRNLFGFYFFGTFYIAGFVGSLVAILLEEPKRQSMLTLYLTNLASESVFLQLRNRGYIRSIPHGQSLLFSIGLGVLMYFKEKARFSDIYGILKRTHVLNESRPEVSILQKFPLLIQKLINHLRSDYSRGPHCEHQNSCVSSAVERAARNFCGGSLISLGLTALRTLKSPQKWQTLFGLSLLRVPLFCALLPLIYHATRCTLNRLELTEKPINSAVAGAASGLSMILYPNTTIAMYVLWKAIEQFYYQLREKNILPEVKYGNILLYSISTGIVIGNVIIEPHSVRSGMNLQHSPFANVEDSSSTAVVKDHTSMATDGNTRAEAANLKSTTDEQESKSASTRLADSRHKKTSNRFHQPQDTRKSGDPVGFREIQEMLIKEGVEKWDKNVIYQFHDFMQQISSNLLDQAKFAAEHRESETIEVEDVEEALNSYNQNFNEKFGRQLEQIQSSINKTNAQPLPKIRCDYGIHAPNERFMTIQPDYVRPKVIHSMVNNEEHEP